MLLTTRLIPRPRGSRRDAGRTRQAGSRQANERNHRSAPRPTDHRSVPPAGLREAGQEGGRGRGGLLLTAPGGPGERPRAAVMENLTMAKAIRRSHERRGEHSLRQAGAVAEEDVRRVKDGVSIEQLAEDIGRRRLVQSLKSVLVLEEGGEETGTFEVPAGRRRYLALRMFIKQKRLAKNEPIPCIVNRSTATSAEEDRSPRRPPRNLHPLDQFRAFKNPQRPGSRRRRDRRALLRSVAGDEGGAGRPAARLGVAKAARSLREG